MPSKAEQLDILSIASFGASPLNVNRTKQIAEVTLWDSVLMNAVTDAFEKNAELRVTKINRLQQAMLMLNGKWRFLCVFHRDPKSGGGYHELFGMKEFKEAEKLLENQVDKMVCFSDLYSKIGFDHEGNKKAIRTIENIHKNSVFVQDLDCYKRGVSALEALEIIGDLVANGIIEMPNIIIFSGKGLQLVWLLDDVKIRKNSKAHKTWKRIQEILFGIFERAGLYPDEKVFNPAHNTRLANTLNSRANNEQVRVFCISTERRTLGYFIERYFSEMKPAFEPEKPAKSSEKKAKDKAKVASVHEKRSRNPLNWDEKTYCWQAMGDVFRIVRWHSEHGISDVGHRWKMATWVRFLALVYSDGDQDFAESQVHEFWLALDEKEGTTEAELMRRSKTALRYYDEFIGVKEYDRKKYKYAGLWYKNETLIAEWDIPVELQVELKVIKHRYEGLKKREDGKRVAVYNKEYERTRKRAENRRKGIQSHESKRNTKMEAIRAILEAQPQASTRDIAKQTGYSVGTVHRYLNQLR